MLCGAPSSGLPGLGGGRDRLGSSHLFVSPSVPPQDLCEVGSCVLPSPHLCLTLSFSPLSSLRAPSSPSEVAWSSS